jgi:hypothetical protein
MSDGKPDFYYVTGEMSAPELVRCWVLKSLKDSQGHDLLLVRVDPPFRRYMPEPIDEVVLAWGNGVGYWLPISVWPMTIYVLSAASGELSHKHVLDQGQLTIIDKGALFQSTEDAGTWLG